MRAAIDKLALAGAIWTRLLLVRRGLARRTLSELCRSLGTVDGGRGLRRRDPFNLGRAVSRATDLRVVRPRCLTLALVHFRLLTEQGLSPVLVVGLHADARSKDAHAWVELDGIDVGPPPGRGDRQALARYDRDGPLSQV